MNTAEQMAVYKKIADEALDAEQFPLVPQPLRDAMRYSLLSPGKRLRAALCMAACEAAGGTVEQALPFAKAIEMIHAYSLIHDDLPAMDNDTLRRGLPTNHVVYGEAMAILAGDALLNRAFETIAAVKGERAYRALGALAVAAGSEGMIAGQALDVSLEGTQPDSETVLKIHTGKTAALITAAVEMGLVVAGAEENVIEAGRCYGYHLGLAFQIVDDLLDLTGDEAQLGKHTGKDVAEGKLTWPACVGREQAYQDAKEHLRAAAEALNCLQERGAFLRELAGTMLDRVR